MSGHTPGPWRYDFGAGYCGELIAPNGTWIATFTDEPNAHNARLIAAAPDLLEALQRLYKELPYINQINGGMQAKAAIAKATGGAA